MLNLYNHNPKTETTNYIRIQVDKENRVIAYNINRLKGLFPTDILQLNLVTDCFLIIIASLLKRLKKYQISALQMLIQVLIFAPSSSKQLLKDMQVRWLSGRKHRS